MFTVNGEWISALIRDNVTNIMALAFIGYMIYMLWTHRDMVKRYTNRVQ